MTIINFVQNNHRTTTHPTMALEWELRFRVLSGWVSHLTYLHQEASKELAHLQAGPAPAEQKESLEKLMRLREETTLGLDRLSLLLKAEPRGSSAQRYTPSGAPAWVWLSLQYFFETWNPELAAFQLWTLVRPVLTAGEGPGEKEREEAASFYELGQLLLNAAAELHRLHGGPASLRS